MSKGDVNPGEQLVEDMSEEYVDMVFDMLEEIAPMSPWWQADVSPDQQLWRWITGGRDEILAWLEAVAPFMGYESTDEILSGIDEIFTSAKAEGAVPQHIVAQIPIPLLEMVQAAGPEEAEKHIKKMERMIAGRVQVDEAIAQARTTLPEIDIPERATRVFGGDVDIPDEELPGYTAP